MSWSLVEGIGLGADATSYVKALRSSVCAVFIVELNYPDNSIVYVNASFEEMTGYHLEDALGQNSSFLQKESDPIVFDEINTAIKAGRKYYGIVKNTHKSGNYFLSELRLSPAHDLKGELTHFVGVLCDMSTECLSEAVQTDKKTPVQSVCNEQGLKRVNEQLLREIQKRYQAEQEQYAQIEYLKNLQKVTQAIGVSSDPERWLDACVEAIREVFQADRAWLLYPCDPDADFFTVPVEAFVSEYPELHESDEPQPISGEIKEVMQHCLAVEKPTFYHQVENVFSNERLSIQSQMLMALKPRAGKPWVLALHQSSHKKNWSEEQQRLFKDIGDHVKELLSSVSLHKELKERENRLRLLLESTEEGIYGIDVDGVCTFANLASAKQLGYKNSSELVGKNIRHLTNFNCPGSGSESSDNCKNCQVQKEGESIFWDGGYFQREDGSHFPVEFRCNPIRYDSSVDRATVTFINITERKKADDKIWHQANYDQLTGLPERSLLMNRLEQAIQTARRDKHRVAVMFIDLDHFKLINDSLGHSAGDLLLVETAQRLRACVRGSDTVARLSGDEFAVILPEVNFAYNVERVAEKILKTLVEPFNLLKDAESFISATIGVSLFPDDSQDTETLLKYADMAMYKAKRSGRNKSAFFTEELNQAALNHSQVEQELRQAIERDELEVYY